MSKDELGRYFIIIYSLLFVLTILAEPIWARLKILLRCLGAYGDGVKDYKKTGEYPRIVSFAVAKKKKTVKRKPRAKAKKK